jgi:membrane protein implicated in regulation of membrane protease activity
MFFLSGFEKIIYFAQSSGKFAKKMGFPLALAQLIIAGVILLELSAPAVIAAYTFTGLFTLVPFFKLAVMALMAFTIIATLLYHNPLKNKEKYYAFMSNLSTLGGLMLLYKVAVP